MYGDNLDYNVAFWCYSIFSNGNDGEDRMAFFIWMFVGCMNQASFEEQKWDVMCEKVHECLSEDEKGWLEFGTGTNLGDDLGECRQEYDEEYKPDFEPDEDCDFDVDDANSCIKKLKEASCADFIEVSVSNDCVDVCD